MNKIIIYKKDNGRVSIITPTQTALNTLSIDDIARKDVPTGKSYKIINASEISSDRTFRNAWTIDEAELTDGVGD